MTLPNIWVFRNNFAGIKLPFYPRGSGINRFVFNHSEKYAPQDFCEICYVNRGKCYFDTGTVQQELNAGQVIFRRPGAKRYKLVTSPEGAEIYYVTFDGENAEDIFSSFGYPDQVLVPAQSPKWLFERIIRTFSSPLKKDYRRLCAMYMELFALLAPDGPRENIPPFVLDCLHQIKMNCTAKDFNINILADILGVHRSTVSRTIRQYTGISAREYLNKCRMDYALELLGSTSLNIDEIARRTGFSRSNYFCRIIRNRFNCTPSELRAGIK